ncbi:Plexin-B1 [Chelonia mydas]|uniref:Plexin-B1 n=1 Tax=Chelonia mydas TaxID=8469 RepID=M7BPG0_CHEMY|nr:Plexin-B1 [Chelonia mydas]
MDSESGTLYLGATNFLFQLTSDLMMESAVQTGPVLDSKDCLPPVSKLECPQAHNTDNHNKLLLVNSVQEELIVCGSVHQGICEKRSLTSIDHVLFRPESPGDTQYVAANDPNITTVGLVGHSKDDMPLLFVGRGYTSRGVGGGIPPITTRNLRAHAGDMQGADSHSIFSYEETAKLAVGRLSEYNHHFIKSFIHRSSVYFLFYRRDLKSQSREYKTYISRICLDDSHYYSYVELPLLCRSKEKTYSILQAAYVTEPGSDLRRGRFSTQGEVLFAAFSAWQASSGKLSEESALCVYTMEEVDRLTTRTRDVCYTKDGKSEEGIEVAYIEYDVSSNCVQLPADTLDAYPCGSDHTPSPMASRVPLETAPTLEKPEARLTAVAVNVEDGHTIAFLGDSRGQLHKVYLGAMGEANTYASLVIHLNSMVSGDLLFDQSQQNLYVMTQSMNEEFSWGPGACPCVQGIQGSSLLPVNVKQKITLLGKNFNLYQDQQWDYECVLIVEGRTVVMDAYVEGEEANRSLCYITCQLHQYSYLAPQLEFSAVVFVQRKQHLRVDSAVDLYVTLYNCSMGHSDCSRCQTADSKYNCVWCGGQQPNCIFRGSCTEEIADVCPAPLIYSNPDLKSIAPSQGPKAGGTCLTLLGSKLLTGCPSEISVLVGDLPCHILSEVQENQLHCQTSPSNMSVELPVTIRYGHRERRLEGFLFKYTLDPNITFAEPAKSFLSGGRVIRVHGHNLDVVQNPKIRITVSPSERRRRGLGRWRRIMPETECPQNALCSIQQFEELCLINSSYLILCKTPAINLLLRIVQVKLEFILDNLSFDFKSLHPTPFSYEVNPILKPLNAEDPAKPYRHKPGSVISVEGENLDLAISKEEVVAMIGEGVCVVKTLTRNHLYCEPPSEQPAPQHRTKPEGTDSLPEFTVQMGNLNFLLGRVQYDTESQLTFPLEAQIGLGVGASFVALIVLIIVFIYRRKSKQALRDYKKVQIQLENLETSVRDRCKKEFTDLMTEMMDLTSDLVGTGIPFLDYRSYAERIFFPGHRESPLQRGLDMPECRRQTVEQGLVQLSNLLNSKLFLTKFIHTLEIQRTFSPRDRAYVASLLTVSLHGKLEYFTDILKTLLNDLVEQYVAKNPKLMLRRTETVVEKLLTNWMSICLYAFVRDSVGEPLYMLFRGIKHQVDKGPVDWVTGKAKYTLNDNRLLREDLEYRTLTLNALTQTEATVGEAEDSQGVSVKVLDCDTITQVKEKILDQIYKGTPYCLRPDPDSLDLEWRSGLAGHLILSDEDVTSVIQGTWKRLNTLQHYKVPDGATVALVPRLTKHIPRENQDYIPGEKTPMLEDADEGGIKLWHLVKPTEEPELPKHRRGSLRDRERAKAIPEIYLTRLLSMKGTLQKFVDDLFQVILSTSRPVPLAVKYFFDLLDDQAMHHGILDPETIHIWKTNSLPLRFWINIIKNPQFVFDVQTSDNVDAVLLVIAQTFMDSCTIADHKLGRDSPINKLLYARDIPRYKQMVERYYADIRQTISASDQEMNSALAELSRNYSGELNSVVALHELYKYINKYYDQIITALEEDPTAQKMQLGYRLQQIAAAVENKVTDL